MPKAKETAEIISIVQLLRMFPDQERCIAWLEKVRWAREPTCAHCGAMDKISQPSSKPHTCWCGHCRKQFTVTTDHDPSRDQDAVAKLDRGDLQRHDGPEGCQRHAIVERAWRPVPHGLVHVAPRPRGLPRAVSSGWTTLSR